MKNNYPIEKEEIKQYLCGLWQKEYPQQGTGLPEGMSWEYKDVARNALTAGNPTSYFKAKRYLSLLQQGTVIFPPLVCINGEVIDGLHRFWAYSAAGFVRIRIYQNIPQTETSLEVE